MGICVYVYALTELLCVVSSCIRVCAYTLKDVLCVRAQLSLLDIPDYQSVVSEAVQKHFLKVSEDRQVQAPLIHNLVKSLT